MRYIIPQLTFFVCFYYPSFFNHVSGSQAYTFGFFFSFIQIFYYNFNSFLDNFILKHCIYLTLTSPTVVSLLFNSWSASQLLLYHVYAYTHKLYLCMYAYMYTHTYIWSYVKVSNTSHLVWTNYAEAYPGRKMIFSLGSPWLADLLCFMMHLELWDSCYKHDFKCFIYLIITPKHEHFHKGCCFL